MSLAANEGFVPGAQALETETNDPMVGRTLGNNTLLARIASGGMAEIYLANQAGPLGRTRMVVVKRILPQLAEDQQFRSMFYDEGRIAAHLEHPNIIRVEDFGEDPSDQSLYMVMEYVEGVPLLDVLRRASKAKEPVDLRWAASVIAQAAEGLHHAHELLSDDGTPLGIVHRDISPHNILVTPNGIVKVFDFGIAKAEGRVTQTAAGVIKGKFAYMSPEQARANPLDRRSDVFSLGTVLWESLTLKRLFSRGNDLDTYRALLEARIPRASELRFDVYPELDQVLDYALQRNPDQRFATARALGQAVTHAVSRYGGVLSNAQVGQPIQKHFGEHLAARKKLGKKKTMPPVSANMAAVSNPSLRRVDQIVIPGVSGPMPTASPATPEPVAVHQGRHAPIVSGRLDVPQVMPEGSQTTDPRQFIVEVESEHARPDEITRMPTRARPAAHPKGGMSGVQIAVLVIVILAVVGGLIAAFTV